MVRAGRMRPGTPVRPMLASITAGAADAATRALGGPGGGRGGGGAGRRDPRNGVGTERDTPVEPSGTSRAGGIGEIGLDGASRTDPRETAKVRGPVKPIAGVDHGRRLPSADGEVPATNDAAEAAEEPRTRRSSPNTNTTAFARRFISCRLMVRVRARRASRARPRFPRGGGWRYFRETARIARRRFRTWSRRSWTSRSAGVVSAATRDSSWTPRSSASTARRGNSARFKIYRRDRDPSARGARRGQPSRSGRVRVRVRRASRGRDRRGRRARDSNPRPEPPRTARARSLASRIPGGWAPTARLTNSRRRQTRAPASWRAKHGRRRSFTARRGRLRDRPRIHRRRVRGRDAETPGRRQERVRASARADCWLKLKKDYCENCATRSTWCPSARGAASGEKRAGSRRFSSPCTTRRRRRTRRCADA